MDGIRPEGAQLVEQALFKEKLDLRHKQISQSTSLKDLAEEYAFYSPAQLELRVDLKGRDPFFWFLSEYNKPVQPAILQLANPLFSGLSKGSDHAWNYTLYLLEKEHWVAWRNYLGSLTLVDHDKRQVSQVRYKEFEVPDVRSRNLDQKVTITAVCLSTNKGCWYFEPNRLGLLESQFSKIVLPETRAAAQAALRGDMNIYRHIDQLKARDGKSPEEVELAERWIASQQRRAS